MNPLIPDFPEFAAQHPGIGAPIGGVQDVPGGGYMQQYQNATAYALFGELPHEVQGAIRDKYNQLGGPTGFLGFPTTDETGCPDGIGRFNHFSGGSIYYHPSLGAFQIGGLIQDEWNSLGATEYGYPNTDESGCADGVGRFNHITSFLPGNATAQASIYWTPATGAHEVRGAIHATWAQLGFETSYLGYPLTDEHDSDGGRESDFQNGSIFWTASAGITLLPQAFTVNDPDITFGSGISVGGNARFQIFSDGTTHFSGHLHDDGFPSYACLVVMSVKDGQNRAYTASESGSVGGTDSPNTLRDLDWDTWGTSEDVRNNWACIRSSGVGGGTASVTSDWSAQKIAEDVASVFGVILTVIAMIFGGSSKGPKPDGDVTYEPGLPPGYFEQRPSNDTGASQ
ncbi:MAG: hypothetical protein P4L26_13105 [Terracidiphilus sp.]|nr:hypothetical protein [Terracidiphilus sp.]